MARYRHIPTRITAIGGLVQALEELGLRNVEVHEQPEPLLDWIGRPTGDLAHVILRGKSLSVAGDDVGFVRNANGTLDLVISDIHLFRFDKGWLEELAKRYDALALVEPHVAQRTEPPSSARPLLTPAPSSARADVGHPWSPAGSRAEASKTRAYETKPIEAKPMPAVARPEPRTSSAAAREDRTLERAERDALSILEELKKGQA